MAISAKMLAGPRGYPFVGHVPQISKDPLSYLAEQSQVYGEVFSVKFAAKKAIFVSKPKLIEQILKDPYTFAKGRAYTVMKSLLGEGLITSEGVSWFHQRRTIQPVFQHQRIPGYAEMMSSITQGFIERFRTDGQRNIHSDMMSLTLGIVMKCIFSQDLSEQDSQTISQSLDTSLKWFDSQRKKGLFFTAFPDPISHQYHHQLQAMNAVIYRIIQERRACDIDNGDLLSMLMQVRDEEDGSQMSDQQLRDEIATLMLTGNETTANALSWLWMLLSQNPDKREKLESEVDSLLGKKSVSYENIGQLSYSKNMLKEAMRLYPPVSIMTRVVTESTKLENYEIPAGYLVLMSPWIMQRNSQYFENPEAFIPERWENDLEKALPKGVYFPFGNGPRICIGKSFAMMEAMIILATITQEFRLNLLQGQAIQPKQSITLRPDPGIQVKFSQR